MYKLYIDSKIFVYNEVLGQVVEHSESVRYGDMMSRPGSMMMGPYLPMSRPGSRTGSRPSSGTGGRGGPGDGTSGVPKLPPLNKQFSMSLPNVMPMEYVDPRDVKMNELEKVIAQYQDKLNDVTSNYQQKIGILEEKIIDKEMDKDYLNGNDEEYLSDSDLSDLGGSPKRTLQRSAMTNSAKSIDVIREEEDEEEDDVFLELRKKMPNINKR